MVIRFEHQPYIGAMGALAYQTGAREAARKREKEERERQMQLLRMRQQQQQAAMDRSYGAWKTRYQHVSGVQQAAADYQWRDHFAAANRDHDRNMAKISDESRWQHDTELLKLREAGEQRMSRFNHIQGMEKQADLLDRQGNNEGARRARTEGDNHRQMLFNGIKPEKRAGWIAYSDTIDKIRINPKLDEKTKADQIADQRRQQLDYGMRQDNQRPNHWESGGSTIEGAFRLFNNNGEIIRYQNDGATVAQYKEQIGWEEKKWDDTEGRKENFVDLRQHPETRELFFNHGERIIGRNATQESERTLMLSEKQNQRAKIYFRSVEVPDVDAQPALSARGAAYPKKRVFVLESAGDNAATKLWGSISAEEFDVNNPAHRHDLVRASVERDYPDPYAAVEAAGADQQQPSYKWWPGSGRQEQQAAPPPGQQGPEGPQRSPGPVTQTSAAPTGSDLGQDVAGHVASRDPSSVAGQLGAEVSGRQPTPAQAAQANLLAREVDDKVAKQAQEFKHLFKPGWHKDIEARREAEKEASMRAGTFKGASPAGLSGVTPVKTSPIPGSPGAPEMAQSVIRRLGGDVALEAGEEVRKVGKQTLQKLVAGAKKVRKPFVPLADLPGKQVERTLKKKFEGQDKQTKRIMMAGEPGERIHTPVAKRRLGKWLPITKTSDPERYNKFHKELRNYAHRLVNNGDAAKDVKIRLDRLKSRADKVTREELADELQVLKVLVRASGVGKKRGRWKDFLYKEEAGIDKVLNWMTTKPRGPGPGKVQIGVVGAEAKRIYPAGKTPRVTAKKILAGNLKHWLTDMNQLVEDLKE